VSLEQTEYFAQICFHFQQAAENYLKAFIIANELAFRPVHNLLELLNICREHDPDVGAVEEACRYLNPIYIDTRYPVHWPSHYDREAATRARDSAEAIRDWVITALTRTEETEEKNELDESSSSTTESL
jgi:HEPN domain-containing protein